MTQHVLVSILHKAIGTPPRFKTASYDFSDQTLREGFHFGLPLLRYLSDRADPPNSFVVFGTAGSSWGRYAEALLGDRADAERELIGQLDAASEGNAAATTLVAKAELAVRDALREATGISALEVRLRVIDYLEDRHAQGLFVSDLAEHVPREARLSLDATHGLRHLQFVAMVSAMALRRLKQVKISGIYYAAMDLRRPIAGGDEIAPVLRMDDLPRSADWLAAHAAFDKDGDYGVFSDLLLDAGVARELVDKLGEAAFSELIGDFEVAHRRLVEFERGFRQSSLSSGTAELFREELTAAVSWTGTDDLYARQRSMALRALERGDLFRATMFGREAYLTRYAIGHNLNPMSASDRDKARDRANDGEARNSKSRMLRILRNQMAHASFRADDSRTPEHKAVLELVTSRTKCLEAVRHFLAELLPERLVGR